MTLCGGVMFELGYLYYLYCCRTWCLCQMVVLFSKIGGYQHRWDSEIHIDWQLWHGTGLLLWQRIRYRLTALTRNILIDIIVESYSMREREREMSTTSLPATCRREIEREGERLRLLTTLTSLRPELILIPARQLCHRIKDTSVIGTVLWHI